MPVFVRGAAAACFRERIWRVLVLALLPLACSFPKYEFSAGSAGGEGGTNAGNAGGIGFGGAAGALAGGASGAGTSGASGAPTGGTGASGGLPACVPTAGAAGDGTSEVGSTAALPAHCSNGKKDSDETGLDCGGPTCRVCFHAESCEHGTDCISGVCSASSTCAQVFELEYLPVVNVRSTDTLQFQLRLTYLGSEPVHLEDVAIRYYFARGDVADPVVPFATVALLNGTSIAPQTVWNIVRVLPNDASLVDSYLEVTFTSTKVMLTNDVVELTQSIEDGSAAGRQFDQDTHYSYQNVNAYTEENTATVYRAGTLMWGVPPVYSVPEQCFYTAVNFGGEAVTAGGIAFSAGSDPIVDFSGTTFHTDTSGPDNTTPSPLPDASYLPLLESAIVLDGTSATLHVPNGNYWAYPYVISGDGANTADLLLQGKTVGTFSAESVDGGPAWARLGPFPIAVTNGALVLASNGGAVRVAGIELYVSAQ